MKPEKRAQIRKQFVREFCKGAKLQRATPEDFARSEHEIDAGFPAAYVSFLKEVGSGVIPGLAQVDGMTLLSPLEAVATSRKAWEAGMPRNLIAIVRCENELLCFRQARPGQRRVEDGLWRFQWAPGQAGHAGHAGWAFDSFDECLQDYHDDVYERDEEE